MHWECLERFPRHRGLAIPTYITARAWRTCHDACRNRELAVSFEVGGGENVPGIPDTCTTRNFTCLVGDPWLGVRLQYWITFNWKYQIQSTLNKNQVQYFKEMNLKTSSATGGHVCLGVYFTNMD